MSGVSYGIYFLHNKKNKDNKKIVNYTYKKQTYETVQNYRFYTAH